MTDTTRKREQKYCYCCGRRLNKEAAQCWYCSAMTRETVRPPKRCNFCGEAVRADAIKCRHCGEFLDGREQPQAAAPSQVVFVVDRELLRAAQDQRLVAGQTVPPEIARALAPETVRAIESNQPRLIEQPGVKAIAAPTGETIIDTVAQATTAAGPGRQGEGSASALQVRPSGASSLPARREDTPQAVMLRLGLTLGHGLGMLARYVWKSFVAKPYVDPDTVDVEADTLYKVCEACGEEIKMSDNFCCFCGFQHHALSTDKKKGSRVHYPPTGGIYLVVVLLNAGLYGSQYLNMPIPAYLHHVLPGVAALFCVLGFVRRRRFASQALAVLLLLATVGLYFGLIVLG